MYISVLQTSVFNPFIPGFLKLTNQALNLDHSIDQKRGVFTKDMSRMGNSIDPDEIQEPSHLDLCCLQISVKASLGMNELNVLFKKVSDRLPMCIPDLSWRRTSHT